VKQRSNYVIQNLNNGANAASGIRFQPVVLSVVLSLVLAFAQPAASAASNYDAYKAYIKGVLEFKAGLFEDAKKDYERAASLDASALSVLKDLAYLYWQLGNKEKAYSSAEKIYAADAENVQTLIFLAIFYLLANDFVEAKKYLEQVLALDPENETATVYLASYYYFDNRLQESAEYWNKFLKQQPDSFSGYLQLGMVQEKLSMPDEALKSYDKVIELQPDARDAYIAKARIYETQKRFDLACAEYEKYTEAFPDNPYVLVYLGKCYYENGEYLKAAAVFERAKKSGIGGELTISYWLSSIYEKIGDINKAAKELEEFVKGDANVSALSKLGYYYSLLKEFKKSEKILLKAVNKDPLNHEPAYLLALNYMDWEKYGKAIEYLNKTTELSPDFADAYFLKGSACDKLGDFENAQAAFLKTLEINPAHTRALNYLGYSYADRNINLDEAEGFLNRALEKEPDNGAYIDSLGWIYFKQGKYEEAAKLLLSAANIARDPVMYNHLGDAYMKLGRFGEAWIAYSLSYDAKRDKAVKRKLGKVQEMLPPKELYEKMLLRSESNYKKLPSVKSGFKAKFSSGIFSKKVYLPFNYDREKGLTVKFPSGLSFGNASVRIKDGRISFEPRALETEIPEGIKEILDFVSYVVSADFYPSFKDAEVKQKSEKIIYSNSGGSVLVLNADTALIEEIKQDGIALNIKKYSDFFILKVPSKIKFRSNSLNLKADFEAAKYSLVLPAPEEK
jgi:tetratricopeptide (TPR) repeat protein